MKKIAIFSIFLFLVFAGSARAGMDGFYQLDKKPILKEMQEKINKLPKNKQALAAMGLSMLQSMVMNITLNKNGTASLYVKMSFFGRVKEAKNTGTWTQKDKAIHISIDPPKDKKNKKVRKLLCTIVSPVRIACNDPDKKNSKTLFFDKSSKEKAPAKNSPKKSEKNDKSETKPASN